MGRLGRLCCRCVLLVFALIAVALVLLAVKVNREPPPPLHPPPADPSACEIRAPKPKLGPVHIRKVADFDIVLWGATGFTGKLAAHYLALVPGSFTFAIAGRDWGRLDKLDREIAKKVTEAGHGREAAAILVADSKDVDGLRKIVRKARVVLAAAGPFWKYGQNILKVCAEEGTHYADVAGELFFMRKMIDENMAKAKFSGAKVVIAAGYDSAPFDVGAQLAIEALDAAVGKGAPVKNVWLKAMVTGVRVSMSGGTAASMNLSRHLVDTGKVPKEWPEDPYLLSPDTPCRVDTVVDGWGKLRYDERFGLVGMPHFMATTNARIVRRSLEVLGRRGVSYGEGLSLGAIAQNILFGLRWPSKKNPQPGDGPAYAAMVEGGYEVIILARDEASGRTVRVDIEGRGDPGYMHTSRLFVETGLCLLNVSCHRAGMGGGVFTPVTALDPHALLARFRNAKHEDGRDLLVVNVAGEVGKHGGEL